MKTLELTCRSCGHREICRHSQMLRRVQAIGMLRRAGNPEPEVLIELFVGSLSKLACKRCGQVGLSAAEFTEDDWDDHRLCEVCGKQIPAARLAVFPSAARCVKCAQGNAG